MRLIKLSSNKDTFRTVEFRPFGLNLVIGKKTGDDQSKTINGVGKSLLLTLVHFCLGSKHNPKLAEALPEWEFSLEFEIDGQPYTAVRSMQNRSAMVDLNGETMELEDYKARLQELCFPGMAQLQFLTFRTLIRRFLRERRDAYVHFDTCDGDEKDYNKLIATSYLLGLDTSLVDRKYKLKKELDVQTAKRSELKSSSRYASVPKKQKQRTIDRENLKDRIERIQESMRTIGFVDNFRDLEARAFEVQRSLKLIRNELFSLYNAVRNIEKSLHFRSDLKTKEIQALYEELNFHFPEQVRVQLERVESFHKQLLTSREDRLNSQKSVIEKKIATLKEQESVLETEHQDLYKYLNTKGIMREYSALSMELADLQSRASLIQEFSEGLESITQQISLVRRTFLDEFEKSNIYLKNAEELLNKNSTTFRSFTRKLYPNCTSALTVENRDGENQLRFNIDAHIQNDSSDGINEAKLFCFDLTLLAITHAHKMATLFHDSRLYSEIDPRQSKAMFQLAHEQSAVFGFQYIATLNQNMLENIRTEMNDEAAFQELFQDKIVLTLTDESPAAKLLGIQIDMEY